MPLDQPELPPSPPVALLPSGEPAPTGESSGERRMPFLEHLSELRLRLRNMVIVMLVSVGVSFYFVEKYFDWLTRPVRAGLKAAGHEMNFYARSLTEPFWVYMKLSIVGGLLLASPLIFFEIWRFVAPGLYKRERRLTILVTVATGVCFIGGSVFAYAFMCEPAAQYLTSLCKAFAGDLPFKLDTMLAMDEVASFQMLTLAGCGVAFEIPVLLSVLGWVGIISARGLWRFNRYALVLAFILGAVLTPSTDLFTQTLLSVPIFALYNLSILVVWLIERARRKKAAEAT